MFKYAMVAAALAAFVAVPQGAASAEGPLDLHAVASSPSSVASRPSSLASSPSRNVASASNGVNGAASGTYVAEAYRGGEYQGALVAKFWGAGTTFGCMALSPIVAGLIVNNNEHRQLTSREVHVMLADCTIPFVGGWLMGKYFDSIEPPPAAPTAASAAAPPAPKR